MASFYEKYISPPIPDPIEDFFSQSPEEVVEQTGEFAGDVGSNLISGLFNNPVTWAAGDMFGLTGEAADSMARTLYTSMGFEDQLDMSYDELMWPEFDDPEEELAYYERQKAYMIAGIASPAEAIGAGQSIQEGRPGDAIRNIFLTVLPGASKRTMASINSRISKLQKEVAKKQKAKIYTKAETKTMDKNVKKDIEAKVASGEITNKTTKKDINAHIDNAYLKQEAKIAKTKKKELTDTKKELKESQADLSQSKVDYSKRDRTIGKRLTDMLVEKMYKGMGKTYPKTAEFMFGPDKRLPFMRYNPNRMKFGEYNIGDFSPLRRGNLPYVLGAGQALNIGQHGLGGTYKGTKEDPEGAIDYLMNIVGAPIVGGYGSALSSSIGEQYSKRVNQTPEEEEASNLVIVANENEEEKSVPAGTKGVAPKPFEINLDFESSALRLDRMIKKLETFSPEQPQFDTLNNAITSLFDSLVVRNPEFETYYIEERPITP